MSCKINHAILLHYSYMRSSIFHCHFPIVLLCPSKAKLPFIKTCIVQLEYYSFQNYCYPLLMLYNIVQVIILSQFVMKPHSKSTLDLRETAPHASAS